MRTRLLSPPWCSLDGQPLWAGGHPPRSRRRPVPAAALRQCRAPDRGLSVGALRRRHPARTQRRCQHQEPRTIPPPPLPHAPGAHRARGRGHPARQRFDVVRALATVHTKLPRRRAPAPADAQPERAHMARRQGRRVGSALAARECGADGALDADQRRSSGDDRLVVARCLLLHGSLRGLRSSLGTDGPQRFYRERSVRAPLGSPLWGRKRVAIASGGG